MKTLLPLALVALMGSAGLAAAQTDMIGEVTTQARADQFVTISRVETTAAGMVQVYDYMDGKIGAFLGETPVQSGLSTDVRVPLEVRPEHEAVAVLKVDDQVTAIQPIRFES